MCQLVRFALMAVQVCAAVGLCDQSAGRQMVSHSRKLLVEEQNLGDDTFCQFCTMAVSYIKVSSPFIMHLTRSASL